MKYFFIFQLFFFISLETKAWTPVDVTNDALTRSVQLHYQGLPLSEPIVYLQDNNSIASLLLSFDRMVDYDENITYKVELCNKDWTIANVPSMQYLDGFEYEDIIDYEFSYNSFHDYVHYEALVPSEDMNLIASGNYKITAYLDGDPENILFTRGFLVVEQLFQIIPSLGRTFDPAKIRSHQEVDFTLNINQYPIKNAITEISAVVLQNGNWLHSFQNIKPLFHNEKFLSFDYQNQIVFPAGKEYRALDLRSVKYASDRIRLLTEDEEGFTAFLVKDIDLGNQSYSYRKDINGKFILDNVDDFAPTLESEYILTHFFFKPTRLDTADVYLVGDFTEWQQSPKYKMTFLEEENMYHVAIPIKQGYYNYRYEYKYDNLLDRINVTEGNSQETENQYQIIVYYRPFGARHDRIVGYTQVSCCR